MTFIVCISFQEPRSDGEFYKKGKGTLTLFEIAMHLIECISGHISEEGHHNSFQGRDCETNL